MLSTLPSHLLKSLLSDSVLPRATRIEIEEILASRGESGSDAILELPRADESISREYQRDSLTYNTYMQDIAT